MLRRLTIIFVVSLVGGLAAAAPASAASVRTYTQNFNDYPQGEWLSGRAISSWEVVYSRQQCGGTGGCQSYWIAGYIKPDGGLQDGLEGGDVKGPITARFTYPVTSISVIAQPAVQFNAAYTLKAFDRNGRTVGRSMVVHNGDQELPDFDGFGYFPMSVTHLRAPACSFTFSAKWLAATSSFYTTASYEVGKIVVHLANGRGIHRCR